MTLVIEFPQEANASDGTVASDSRISAKHNDIR